MPTNLYGPGDSFDPEASHVLPALLHRFHLAKLNRDPHVTVWGTGRPRREFLHVDDCADALVLLMKNYSQGETINIGAGSDISIVELAWLVAETVGYQGEVRLDPSKPDGSPRKLLDNTRLSALGWHARIGIREGIAKTYAWLLKELAAGRHLRGLDM